MDCIDKTYELLGKTIYYIEPNIIKNRATIIAYEIIRICFEKDKGVSFMAKNGNEIMIFTEQQAQFSIVNAINSWFDKENAQIIEARESLLERRKWLLEQRELLLKGHYKK